RKSSSRPSRRNRGRFVAEMYSPHTLRRGNRDFSMTATRQPARASSSPAVAPPGPPPMTIASNVCAIFLRGSWLAAEVSRDKTVSEQASGFFLQLPASGRRPQRGQFCAIESSSHAGHGIMAGDPAAADEPKPPARSHSRRVASRLASDKTTRSFGRQPQESEQRRP